MMINQLLKIILLFALAVSAFAQDNLPELVKRIKPSAVAIETFNAKGESLSRGSGFFVSDNTVITNRHVIEKSSRVEIHLINGKKYSAKGVLAIDGEGDLALLQVDVPLGLAKPLQVEKLTPQEGESLVVIGNPFGLEGSVSNGIVSAIREISGYGKIIQITAPISPGSSGSPVVNMRGQVIGVATLQAAEGQSLNFAVPGERITQLKIVELQTFASLNNESVKNKRKSAENFYSQGLRLMARDDFAKALPYFEKATEIDPNYAEAWYQAGFCYGMLGRATDSLRASKNAARLRPNWVETHINIGASSFALGNFKEATEAYRNAVKLDDTNAETHYSLGLSLNKLSRTDEEVLSYKRAINLKPDHANALEKLGAAQFRLKKYNDAIGSFESLKTYKPDSKTYNYLGECYLELSRLDESIDSFNNALSLNPNSEKTRYNLGRAYIKIGDRELANMQYEILKNNKSDWADRLFILLNP
jgi:tetratricopeptide (TPR) repeat protein